MAFFDDAYGMLDKENYWKVRKGSGGFYLQKGKGKMRWYGKKQAVRKAMALNNNWLSQF